MSSARRKGIGILVAVFVVAIMVVTMAVPALAQQGAEIRVTDSEERADQPDVAIDSQGNVHIAYCDYVPADGSYEIFYTMLDNNGSTLIDDTMISDDDGYKSKRPAIVVDSNDKVHIVWQDKRWDGDGELAYTKLDPYKDDRNGDAADEPTITLVDDKRITYSDSPAAHARIAIDSNDDIHIVWETGELDSVHYMKIDNNGNELVAETVVSGEDTWRASPDVAVDSNNNAHITWNDREDTWTYETYYMMLDGSDGSTLIDATLITPDDDYKSKGQSIVVDFEDKVHIIWKDQRGDGQAVYYTKLDPSLDGQDGDSANESVITLIDDMAISTDAAAYWVKLVASAIQCGRHIHISWWEDYDDNRRGYLYYMVLDTDGNTEVTERTLTTTETVTTSTGWTVPYLDADSNGKAHIVWCDERHMNLDGGWEVYYTNYEGPPCTCSPEFSATPTTGPIPLEVQFTDESARDFTSWSWDFGDGGTSTEQNPMHVYTRPGPFTVSLNVSGPCGSEIETKVDYIHPYSSGVGGEAYPVNKLAVLAPWIAASMAIMAGSFIVLRRRRAQS